MNYNMIKDDKNIIKIQVRIIELTNRKISLERQLNEIRQKLDKEDRYFMIKELNSSRNILADKLVNCEQMLFLNKQLLNQTNEYEYQLEN